MAAPLKDYDNPREPFCQPDSVISITLNIRQRYLLTEFEKLGYSLDLNICFSLDGMGSCYGEGKQEVAKDSQDTAGSIKMKIQQKRSGEVHGRERTGQAC
jgi:hypothetical protein